MAPHYDRYEALHAPRPQYYRHASEQPRYPHRRPSRDQSPEPYDFHSVNPNPARNRLSAPISAPGTRQSSRPNTPSQDYYQPRNKRYSWPPSPLVEDERRSRAREVSPPAVVDPAVAEVKARGTSTQEPVILENNQPYDIYLREQALLTARQEAGGDECIFGPAPRRTTDRVLEEGLHFNRRAPAPYSHTAAGTEKDSRKRDSGYAAHKDFAKHSNGDTIPSEALRGKGKSRRSISRGSTDRASTLPGNNDSSRMDYDRQPPAKFAPAHAMPEKNLREPIPQVAKLKAQQAMGPRRSNSESFTTMPRLHLDLRKDAAVMAGIALDPSQFVSSPTSASSPRDFTSQRKGSASDSSRPSTPEGRHSRRQGSPPRSPRHSSGRPSAEDSPRSVNSSRGPSRASSRQSSPTRPVQLPTRANFDKLDDLYQRRPLALADDRTQRTSRLMSSMTPSSADLKDTRNRPSSRHGPVTSSRSGTALPYPVDDLALMPSEEDHRYRPRALDTPTMSPAVSPTMLTSPQTPTGTRPALGRPGMIRAHTQTDELPRLSTAPFGILSSPSVVSSPKTTSAILDTPPPCLRSRPMQGLDDWYTLEQAPKFNICRGCVEANFGGTPYERHFRLTSRNPESKIVCDFASHWSRLAWKLDQQRHQTDLSNLHAVARVMIAELACPGVNEGRTRWYTVNDEQGDQLSKFNVCATDIKFIRALLPHAGEMFDKNEESSGRSRRCDLRCESKRFHTYLELLNEVENAARKGRREREQAEDRFYQNAFNNTKVRECTKSEMLEDARWHFIPGLPEFTVCKECYAEVVWPQISQKSRVALDFNQTPSRINARRNSASSPPDLQSCQLYSDRMRRNFDKACRDNNSGLLERKARERKEVELDTIEARRRFAREEQRLKREDSRGALLADVRRRMDELEAQWKKWE